MKSHAEGIYRSPVTIREHLAALQYPCEAWRDPAHFLVRYFGVTVAPEVAVFVPNREIDASHRSQGSVINIGLAKYLAPIQKPSVEFAATGARCIVIMGS
jgi:hypothetical protein